MENAYQKMAELLNNKAEVIEKVDKKMFEVSGKTEVIDELVKDVEEKRNRALADLGLSDNSKAEEVFEALVKKIEKDDKNLFDDFGNPDFAKQEDAQKVLNRINDLADLPTSFYLREAKAHQLFRQNPPRQIMAALGYDDIEEFIKNEDYLEMFCALRIVEDKDWLNNTFFAAYTDLKPGDFEERKIQVMALPERWVEIGRKFSKKKLHHMSHLKEMGVVFLIPTGLHGVGELIYTFFMTLHYLHEVDWHAHLFASLHKEEDFAEKMIEVLKVGVEEAPEAKEGEINWRVIPTYLGKKDKNDPRLADPRINPEDYHYIKAAEDIKKFAKQNPESGLKFWNDLDYVAGLFENQQGQKDLISFSLFDVGITLLGKLGLESKYLYHQQEALWNVIFAAYMGEKKMNELMMTRLNQGYFTL